MNLIETQLNSDGKTRQRGRTPVFRNAVSACSEITADKWKHLPKHVGVKNSIRFVKKNFDKPIGVTNLAAAAGLSRRGIFKAFRRYVGIAPGKVLRLQRLEAAKEILSNSDLPLKKIPALAGYKSANSFYVAFKNATGISPGNFRARFSSISK